jgi:hypothetical protein
MMLKRAGAALLLAGALVGGAAGSATAAGKHPIHAVTMGPACRAGLHLMRAQRGTFDWRYDHILVKGIIGTACARGGSGAGTATVCARAKHMYGLFDPLFRTDADRDRGRAVVDATCA